MLDKIRTVYKVIHADNRHGDSWPMKPRSSMTPTSPPVWTGWLTHREYDVIEYHYRFKQDSIYNIGKTFGLTHDSSNRLYYNLKNAGLIDGKTENFVVTPMGKILFDMTDQYMLCLVLEDD